MTNQESTAGKTANAGVVEPLEALGRFAWDWAEILCDKTHGCADYHRMWTLVRLLESDGALPAGSAFFDAELPKAARDGTARVLVSGGADTGLMTLAVNACARADVTPEIVMMDRCETPITQCRLFARQIGVAFDGFKGTLDTLDIVPVDAIVAHSFLAFIPQEARPALFQAWSRHLRPGGRVLMSQRLLAPGAVYDRERPADKIAARRADLAAAFEDQTFLNADVEQFLSAAERLWLHEMGGNGVSQEQIAGLCADSGLVIETIAFDGDAGSVSPFALKSEAVKRRRAGITLVKPD